MKIIGPVLLNNVQAPAPLKSGQIFFLSQKVRNALKHRWKQFSDFFLLFSFSKILILSLHDSERLTIDTR